MNKQIADRLIDFELGLLNEQEILQLFSALIKSGMAWTLQGNYGRTAAYLIKSGIIDEKGQIL